MISNVPSVADALRADDYVLVPDVVRAELLTEANALADSIAAAPDEPTSDGLSIWHFPFDVPGLDNLLETEGLVDACRTILGTKDLLLNNLMLWVRDADDSENFDTRFHRDYPDNALVASRFSPDALGVIIYLSDVGAGDGPTRYVPRREAAGLPPYPRWISDSSGPLGKVLDNASVSLHCRAGTALFHSLLGVHRASKPARPGRRITMHMAVRRADAHWMAWTPWPRLADSDRFRRAFAHLTPTMRGLIGWPSEDWQGWQDPAVEAQIAYRFGKGVVAHSPLNHEMTAVGHVSIDPNVQSFLDEDGISDSREQSPPATVPSVTSSRR